MRWFALLLVAACSSPSAPAPSAPEPSASRYQPKRDSIPIVDSHVHLAFYPVAEQLAAHGVGGAVDLASPESSLGAKFPIPVIQAGPMLTRPNGYPLDAWGRDGYGIGCDSIDCVTQAVDRLHTEGARIIKIALDEDGLNLYYAAYATGEAHKLGMKVVVHAFEDSSVRGAATMGADVLAHTPVDPLSDRAIQAWQADLIWNTKPGDHEKHPRAVITTLAAFGGSRSAIDNLRRLREAGVTVLYGTDLGNLRVDGPSNDEMALMRKAGMTDDEIHAAMTTVPWHFWGFDAIERR